jgi:uncharacterized membrane protein YgdD (TMEM256/DUF423 family)
VERLFLLLGSLLGGLAVALGAFGAHTLESRLTPERLANFETAARYQMTHALALLAVALWLRARPDVPLLNGAGWLFVVGIVLFCGSLYLLSVTGMRWLGAVAPLGGIAFIAGWGCLFLAAWRQ